MTTTRTTAAEFVSETREERDARHAREYAQHKVRLAELMRQLNTPLPVVPPAPRCDCAVFILRGACRHVPEQ